MIVDAHYPLAVKPPMSSPDRLTRHDGATIAYHRLAGSCPGTVFLGGFRSDVTGTKASFIEDYCRRRGQAFVRSDYFRHGASRGAIASGAIGRCVEDAVTVLNSLAEGPQILVGSSIGGRIMLRAALRPIQRIHALLGWPKRPISPKNSFGRGSIRRNGASSARLALSPSPPNTTRRGTSIG